MPDLDANCILCATFRRNVCRKFLMSGVWSVCVCVIKSDSNDFSIP